MSVCSPIVGACFEIIRMINFVCMYVCVCVCVWVCYGCGMGMCTCEGKCVCVLVWACSTTTTTDMYGWQKCMILLILGAGENDFMLFQCCESMVMMSILYYPIISLHSFPCTQRCSHLYMHSKVVQFVTELPRGSLTHHNFNKPPALKHNNYTGSSWW